MYIILSDIFICTITDPDRPGTFLIWVRGRKGQPKFQTKMFSLALKRGEGHPAPGFATLQIELIPLLRLLLNDIIVVVEIFLIK